MKIFINRKPVQGPWGGGNKTLSTLCQAILDAGHQLTFELDNDCGVIICFDPRPSSSGYHYSHFIDHKNRYGSKIIQRIGDVGSHSKPELTALLQQVIPYSDHCIFTSKWARDYLEHSGHNFSVIYNGALPVFYNHRKKTVLKNDKIKIVTHHWSDNEKKGFDIYSFLGQSIASGDLDCVDFTYIGRYSKNFSSEGITVVEPKDKKTLSEFLPEYDIYLTASVEEAGANHVLEAMACGLPVLYREGGGSIEEYCREYGVKYSNNAVSVLSGILKISNSYDYYSSKVSRYSRTSDDVAREYMEIINNEIN